MPSLKTNEPEYDRITGIEVFLVIIALLIIGAIAAFVFTRPQIQRCLRGNEWIECGQPEQPKQEVAQPEKPTYRAYDGKG